MSKKLLFFAVIALLLLLSACQPPSLAPTVVPPDTEPATATSEPPAGLPTVEDPKVLISEVLGGIKGNNNYEFIELYNPGAMPVDLNGWTLSYRLNSSEEDLPVYKWQDKTLVPAQGHYLLVREGEDVGLTPDATFAQPLNTFNGGLALRQPDRTLSDQLGWGKAPEVFTEGTAAEAPENGVSLERKPGDDAGNGEDSDDNVADFFVQELPNPQNSGSPLTPEIAQRLIVQAKAPEQLEPGSQFSYELIVSNQTGQDVTDVIVEFNLPQGLELGDLAAGVTATKQGQLLIPVGSLAEGDTTEISIPVSVPWTYMIAVAHSYNAQAADWPDLAVGSPVVTDISGGVIPIATARNLMESELAIQGTATMYTGGLYAGGGNTKFYVQDDSGGLQVQVFGGEGPVNVTIGDKVRVFGEIGAYRGSGQIVPVIVPDDVEIVESTTPDSVPEPMIVTIAEASTNKETLPGMLVQVEGIVSRVEEFTYSYEIDLTDDEGQVLNLYVDKLTNIGVETIKTDTLYQATGILEVQDGRTQLYPRLQSDLREVFPPILLVTAEAPSTVEANQTLSYIATVFNHTEEPMTNIQVEAMLPATGVTIEDISDGGEQEGDVITWTLPELPGGGTQASVYYTVSVSDPDLDFILSDGFSATADQWPETAQSGDLITFIGNTVPIWAIQGPGASSPYVIDWLSTKGVVTGIFPELDGMFIQELETDSDPNTSSGLFINLSQVGSLPEVEPGNQIEITGQVRETGQQTQLLVEDASDLIVLEEDEETPESVEIDPPAAWAAAEPYFESLEGMLVQITGPAKAVSPTTKYGEYVVVRPEWEVDRLWQGDDNGFAIMVDDSSSATHTHQSTLPYVVNAGDEVNDLIGPLAFTYDRYKIEPITEPLISTQFGDLPILEPVTSEEISLMTWNAENLFDAREPNPADPPMPSLPQYNLALEKVANTIVSAGYPILVGLQEIENIGVLEDVAKHDLLADYVYEPVLIEGTDSRGIDVGYLVRSDRATISDVQQFVAPEGLTSRPPLLVQVEIETEDGPKTLYVLNNHFTSMSGGEKATEPRRIAQADWNVQVIEENILADDPDALVAVMGDLNSFYQSPPIDALRDAGLRHVMATLPDEKRYDYIYLGESQVLDHILVTPNLFDLLKDVEILHVNADYAPAIPDDPSPMRKSDHDPVIAIFSLTP